MKKLLLRLLLAALPVSVFAQKTITVPLPADLADKAWVETRLKTVADSIRKLGPGTTPPVVVVSKPECVRGPVFYGDLKDVTNTSLKFQFDGFGVDTLTYDIHLSGAGLIKSGIEAPKTSIVQATYPVLPDGVYTITIQGKSCKSEPKKATFVIKSNQSDAGTSVPPPTAPGLGNTVVKKVVSGLKENMNIYFVTLKDGSRVFSDSADFNPVNGQYEFWYGVNNHIIKQSVPLRNYKWPSNTPLQVWKVQMKKGMESIFRWGDQGGWWIPDGGVTFSHNDYAPFASFFFQGADSAYNVNRQTAHWMDFQPDITLPIGKIWVMPIGSIDSPELLLRKGVTHFSKYQTDKSPFYSQLQKAGRIYDEVSKTDAQFGLVDRGSGRWVPGHYNEKGEWVTDGWPNNWNERFFGAWDGIQREPLTYQQGYEAGLRYQIDWPVVVFENQEQDHGVSASWPFMGGFYDAYMPRMFAKWRPLGIEPRVANNYFGGISGDGATLGSGGREANKSIFGKAFDQWPRTDYSPGGTLSKTTMVCHAYYLKSPDMTRDEPFRFMFGSRIAKLAGKELVFFPQSTHEHNPNNYKTVYYKDGTLFMRTKQEYNPAELITMSFLAQTFGVGTIPFGASAKNDEKFRFSWQWHRNDGYLWKKKGANDYAPVDQFPYWNEQEKFAGGPFEYCLSEGVRLYSETFAKVIGGQESFLEFRIDGKGDFYRPDTRYYADVVDAYHDKRGVVYAQEKNGYLAVFYLNPYADTGLHKVEYRYKGKTYGMNVHSTIVHPTIFRL